ncbi:YqkE family protein [Saccharibacillus qingshengii]|jgi:single-stranded DNA-specific DHH superfamily exonuclease|uniref:YqkE family protein n=1 Tax=Saccharibacillus qingshengii TaxID=1763540 RepID=UPI001554E096|nr:YqkE family protein [Saccharibacillus qingshengii]
MAAKKKQPAARPSASDKPATLKDMLNPEVLAKLQAQANELKASEEERRQEEQRLALEAKQAERKRLENDFEYLLGQSESKKTNKYD